MFTFRKYKIGICSTIMALALVGCTDLDIDIESQYTKLPENERAAAALSAEVYAAYRAALGRNHWTVQTLAGDEAVSLALGGDYYDGGKYRDMHLHSWKADNDMLADMWNSAMNGITLSNNVLASLNDAELQAPIRAMRAFYYFILMDNFGAVPVLMQLGDDPQDRSSRAEICELIETELLEVMDQLPDQVNSATYGKATKYMAQALLAKLYLNWNVYTASDVAAYHPQATNPKLDQVVQMCDAIIQSGQFNLSSHRFLEKFRPDNGPQIKDFIFAFPYDSEKQQGMVYGRLWSHRSAQHQFGQYAYGPAGIMRVLPAYLDKFNLEGDDRNASYIGGLQYYWSNYEADMSRPFIIKTTKRGVDQDYQGSDADEAIDWHMTFSREIKLRPDGAATLNAGNDQKGRSMGYRSIKFYKDVNTSAAHGHNQNNDVPVFRYADILLMKAEAILRGAQSTLGDSPMSLINQIRAYVNASEIDREPTLADVLDERAREFADESWRRNDLIRYGMFEDDWGFRSLYPAGFSEKFRRIFPVPTSVLNVNTNWSQNPGY